MIITSESQRLQRSALSINCCFSGGHGQSHAVVCSFSMYLDWQIADVLHYEPCAVDRNYGPARMLDTNQGVRPEANPETRDNQPDRMAVEGS